MKLILRVFVLFSFLIASVTQMAFAESEVRIVVDDGVDNARPIAIVPFKWNGTGDQPIDVAKIIKDDLRNSGKFNPINPVYMPQQPTSSNEVIPESWTKLGIDAVVVGQITPNDKGYGIAFQLVDTLGISGNPGSVLLQKQYSVTKKGLRLGVHTISDDIFLQLTGIRGAFRTKIAYIVQKDGGNNPYQLRVADYDGHNQMIVYSSADPLMSPAWSADGKRIAYVTFENNKSQLVMKTLTTGKRQILASFPGHNGAPAFSPDGTKLAFASNKDGVLNIYILNLQTNAITQLTHNSGNNTEPSWSSNGESIIFTSDRTGRPQVYSMSSIGSNVTQLTSNGMNYSGSLTPDGETLVMVSNDHIVTRNLVTGDEKMLSSTFLDETPSISPNGLMIIYSSTQGLGKVLQLVSLDGRFKARLPGSDGQVKFPAWSPYLYQH